jgi:hypothetical protein
MILHQNVLHFTQRSLYQEILCVFIVFIIVILAISFYNDVE